MTPAEFTRLGRDHQEARAALKSHRAQIDAKAKELDALRSRLGTLEAREESIRQKLLTAAIEPDEEVSDVDDTRSTPTTRRKASR